MNPHTHYRSATLTIFGIMTSCGLKSTHPLQDATDICIFPFDVISLKSTHPIQGATAIQHKRIAFSAQTAYIFLDKLLYPQKYYCFFKVFSFSIRCESPGILCSLAIRTEQLQNNISLGLCQCVTTRTIGSRNMSAFHSIDNLLFQWYYRLHFLDLISQIPIIVLVLVEQCPDETAFQHVLVLFTDFCKNCFPDGFP